MPDLPLPDLSKDVLVDLGGWAILKEARALVEAGAVHGVSWEAPVLRAEVGLGAARFTPQLNLKSMVFAENRCNCPTGRRGQICAHAIAACLAARAAAERPPPPAPVAVEPAATRTDRIALRAGQDSDAAEEKSSPATSSERPTITSLKITPQGKELRLRVLLPPNLNKTAPRDAIMVKIEVAVGRELLTPEKLFRGTPYTLPDGHEKAYALLEDWCGGKPSGLLQLRRSQLKALLGALRGEPFVYFLQQPGKPLEWVEGRLAEVHPFLVETEGGNPASAAAPKVANAPNMRPAAPLPPSRANPLRAIPAAPTPLPASRPRPIEVRRSGSAAHPINAPTRSPAVEAMKAKIATEGTPGTHLYVDGSTQFLVVSLPDREQLSYEPALALLKENDFKHEPSNRRWWLRDRHRTLNFLAAHEQTLRKELDAKFSENFTSRTAQLRHVKIELQTQAAGQGFSVSLRLAAGRIDPSAIYRAMGSGQFYVDSDDGTYLFDPAQLDRLKRAQQALSGEKERALTPVFRTQLRSSQLRDAEAILEDLDDSFVLPVDWTRRSGALKQIDKLERPPLDSALDERLRVYQRLGVAWLWHLYRHELGGILADEMGLGKTIQALGLIQCVVRSPIHPGPVLVVCPASLLGNWAREATTFAPELRVFTHHRESRFEDATAADKFDLILTSYPTLARDEDLFRGVTWNTIIADEAQHIKNRRTQAARALRAPQAHARFVLTGTPVENSLDDLRSIFAFLLPGYLARIPDGVKGEDKAWFDGRHRAQAAPYILRRTKQLVAPELPPKIEQVVFCDLGTTQRALYQRVREASEKAIFEMEMAGKSENQVRLAALTQLLRLRQVCAEPRLLDETLTPSDSAKLEAFLEILEEALDDGHRMLVFSQFVSVLGHLRTYLESIGVRFCYLDGSTRDRLAVCDTFNNDSGIPVFLISLKAGGVGLNLTGADTVVHFDPWWNPAVEDQATDRAHRLGQTRTVTSYKLIAADTVEEKVLALQRTKAELLRDVLDESAAATAKVSLADLKSLIR